jgi:hypothetical protein
MSALASSSASPSLVEQVVAALGALSDPRQSQAANKWLLEFEKTPAAWDVAAALLREQQPGGAAANGNHRFHGANILHHKIRQDFLQLQSK